MQTPCLFRFPDIVNDRIQRLQDCFDNARARYKYEVSMAASCSAQTEAAVGFRFPASNFWPVEFFVNE